MYILLRADAQNNLEADISPHQYKKRRIVAQTSPASKISLQQIRQEIDQKVKEVCNAGAKLCQEGPQRPPGEPVSQGEPGYKGEKGEPGKPGPRGPFGPVVSVGPIGPQGVKGVKGEEGIIGLTGMKGEEGLMGVPGEKGSTGVKGSKGNRGSMGVKGAKGECIVPPKISVFPVSQDVFLNRAATFYCWVHGVSYTKTMWQRLGGGLAKDTVVHGGVLHIRSVQRSHAASYLCKVHTGNGTFRAIGTLRIKGNIDGSLRYY